MKKFARKALLFATGLLLLLFFTNNFGLIDIQKTAIVTAIGIDAAEEGGFDVTAQIAVPDASGADTASNVTVRGTETVGEAIAELNRKTGWFPYARTLQSDPVGQRYRAGKRIPRPRLFPPQRICGRFLPGGPLRDDRRRNSRRRLAHRRPRLRSHCQSTLRRSSKDGPGLGDKPARFCQRLLFGRGKRIFTAAFRLAQAKSEGGSGGQSGDSGNSSSAGGSGSGKSGGSSDVFDASRTALFVRGQLTALLETEETLAYNLAVSGTDMAFGDVIVYEGDREVIYHLKIDIGKKSQKLQIKGALPVLEFSIRAQAQVVDANKAGTRTEIAATAIVPDHVLRAAEERFEKELRAAADKAHATGCDLFALKQKLHRFHPRNTRRCKKICCKTCASPVTSVLKRCADGSPYPPRPVFPHGAPHSPRPTFCFGARCNFLRVLFPLCPPGIRRNPERGPLGGASGAMRPCTNDARNMPFRSFLLERRASFAPTAGSAKKGEGRPLSALSLFGVPAGNRTRNLQRRRLSLYPIALRTRARIPRPLVRIIIANFL